MSIHAPRHDFLTAIQRLGLTKDLKLCLDAGHEGSLPAASTKWLDLSDPAAPDDFFRGTTAGAEGSDPTINGSPGARSSAEYLSFDGGDFCRYDSGNEAWMTRLHQDNAHFTFMLWAYILDTSTAQDLFGSCASVSTGQSGVDLFVGNTGLLRFIQGSTAGSVWGSTAVPTSRWNCLGVSIDEANSSIIMMVNDTFEDIASAYSSPWAGGAQYTFEIGAGGNASRPIHAGGRMANFAAWEGGHLTKESMRALYQATRGKFGV